MRGLVEFAPYFRSLNDFSSFKGSRSGLAAPRAKLSGYCQILIAEGIQMFAPKSNEVAWGLLFPVARTSYLCFSRIMSLLSLWLCFYTINCFGSLAHAFKLY